MATWPVIIDDDGSGEIGTPTDKALFDQIKGYVDSGSGVLDGSLIISTGSGPDITLPGRPFTYISLQPFGGDIVLRSLTMPPPSGKGQQVLFENVGTYTVWFQHATQSLAGTAGFNNRVGSASTPIAPKGSALYVFDGGWWFLAQHNQGTFIRIPFSAAHFGTAGDGTWTVSAGQVSGHDFYLEGNKLSIMVSADGTVAGTPNTLVVAGFPFAFVASGFIPCVSSGSPTGWGPVLAAATGGTNYFTIQRSDFAAFPAANQNVTLSATFRVT